MDRRKVPKFPNFWPPKDVFEMAPKIRDFECSACGYEGKPSNGQDGEALPVCPVCGTLYK